MRALNKRQADIVSFLAAEQDWVPANQVAERIQASVSTLRREIENINLFFENGDSKIISKPGLGLKLESASYLALPHEPGEAEINEILDNKRLIGIASDLLTQSPVPVSLSALSEKYYVSRTSIVEDLKKIAGWIATRPLTLVKNHSGTFIDGDNHAIRLALKDLVTHCVIRNYPMADSRIDRFSKIQLVSEFGQINVEHCIQLIALIEDQLDSTISEPYYTNLFSHLLVTIRRAEGIITAPALAEGMPGSAAAEWSIAERAVDWLSDKYGLRFPAKEVSYIYQYLISSGRHSLPQDNNDRPAENGLASDYADRLISEVSRLLGLNFRSDSGLCHHLLSHIKPMLNRFEYGITIFNPLLNDIKAELGAVFFSVRQAAEKTNAACGFAPVSDDEVAYLAVYFQTAIDKIRAGIRIIIVCSSGVGTSQLLSGRINRAFPEWDIVDIVSGSQLHETLQHKHCDLVISTIRLENIRVPVAYVSALFSRNDIARVSECLFSEKNQKECTHAG